MRETNGRQRRVSTKLKAAVGALLAIFAFGATGAQAASTPGGPIQTDFNYVGINVTALGNELNQLVLTPTTPDPAGAPGAFLPPLKMNGVYSDALGNFTLPKATGFDFPKLAVSIGPAAIEAEIGLTDDAHGTYDDATGAMSLDAKISLTLGTDHLEDIEGLPISGEGKLKCQVAPLNVAMSTNAINWPAPGTLFGTTTSAAPAEGAISGYWNTKPKVKSLVTENASLCPLIGGLLEPVGGLFLANSSAEITDLPAATDAKPAPKPCPAGTTGTPGTPTEDCKLIPPPQCEEGTTGTFPNCVPIVIPPPEPTPFKVSKVAISGPGKVKAGKQVKLKIKVTNSGETGGVTTVFLKSSNKKVKLPKKLKVTILPGKTTVRTIAAKAAKKAKGKAKITAKSAGKSAKKVLKVKSA